MNHNHTHEAPVNAGASLISGGVMSRPSWAFTRPATTIVGEQRLAAPTSARPNGRLSPSKGPEAPKLTVEEMATLQSYPNQRIVVNNTTAHIKALDLFAGTGWGVACQRLGIKEVGVEIMPEAIETRTANGMETIYRDVWDGLTLTEEQHREQYGSYGLLIASPPCQTFSLAGKGAGRAALDEVLEAIQLHAYKDADALKAFGEAHDMRTALVLSPLAYVWRDRPRLVAMEQVPTVLPVWEACAEVMREWGYEVKVEILNAEQYGVPQTRKRAILVARRGGPVDLPRPTHSKYYSTNPGKLDLGVEKWVSMAEALGWGFTNRTAVTVGNAVGRGLIGGSGAKESVVRAINDGSFISSPHGDGSDYANHTRITVDEAAALQSYPTGAAKNMGRGMVERYGDRPGRSIDDPAFTVRASAGGTEPGGFVWKNEDETTRKATPSEVGILQTYERPFVWCGTKTKQFLQIGNAVPPLLAEHILAALVGIPTSDSGH